MSFDSTESAYNTLLLNNYISLIGCTIVVYDYILTFSKEIDYVWRRRWTWVSAVFILVRYPGLCWALLNAFHVSPSAHSPRHQSKRGHSAGSALFLVSCWTFPVFICAGNLVMILRVYAMWSRSRTILFVLLFFYMLQAIISVVLPAIYNSSTAYFTPTTPQVLDFTVCSGTFSPSVPTLLGVYSALPRLLLSAMLSILAVSRTLKQLVDMYKATKQWQPNRYMSQLARDGISYFVITTFFVIFATPTSLSPLVPGLFMTFCSSVLCCLAPRFIISVRVLYDRELRGCSQGIDTGFGVLSQGLSGKNGHISTILFADVAEEKSWTIQRDEDELGGIQLEVVGETGA